MTDPRLRAKGQGPRAKGYGWLRAGSRLRSAVVP
jgi:hypothetical protein